MGRGSYSASNQQARAIVGQYDISGLTKSADDIRAFFTDAKQDNGIRIVDGRIKVKRETMEQANNLAERLANRMEMVDEQSRRDYEDIRSELTGTYTISAQDRANISDFNTYARSSENVVKIGRNGTSIDTKYQELAARYPQYFGRASNPADQLQEINSVVKELKNYRRKMPASMRAEARSDIRDSLIRGYVAANWDRLSA